MENLNMADDEVKDINDASTVRTYSFNCLKNCMFWV